MFCPRPVRDLHPAWYNNLERPSAGRDLYPGLARFLSLACCICILHPVGSVPV
ncbi:hypothetical protein ASPCADRAFT_208749, partial [Aspergillus carbonarius ITEM 5010]